MGDDVGDKRNTPVGSYFQWPLVIGAALAIAAIYADAELPTRDTGPNSMTVVGVSAPRPAFGSYPGLRMPVAPLPRAVAHYRT